MRRPNIIFSMCDDQRYDFMSCAGHHFIKTPGFDRLAGEGVRFTNCFTAIPLCAPSRATHLTGMYPHLHGVVHNEATLNEGVYTWPELLQQAGYRTAFFGKIHFGGTAEPRPGFDRWVSFKEQGEYDDPTLNVDGKEIKHHGYNTDILTEYALKFIEEEDDRPWALCLWYKAPHGPFTPPDRYKNLYKDAELRMPETATAATEGKTKSLRERKWDYGKADPNWYPDGTFISGKSWDQFLRDYAGTLNSVDDAISRLLDHLEKLNMSEDTLFIHTSDHGYFHGEFQLTDKRWMYDPSIRIPLLIRYPRAIKENRTLDPMVLSMDVPATILNFAQIAVPEHFQGYSLAPLLTGSGEWKRDSVVIEYFEDPPYPHLPSMLCIRTSNEKLIHYLREGEQDEFYDLTKDPEESINVIHNPDYFDRATAMRRKLDEELIHIHYRFPDLSSKFDSEVKLLKQQNRK